MHLLKLSALFTVVLFYYMCELFFTSSVILIPSFKSLFKAYLRGLPTLFAPDKSLSLPLPPDLL